MSDVKKDAIAHYDRMIEWAEKQIPSEKPDLFTMEIAINEDWYSDHCAYCKTYYDECYNYCDGCPLTGYTKGCCNGRW